MIDIIIGFIKGTCLFGIVCLLCFCINIIQLITIPLYIFSADVNYYLQSFMLGSQIRLMHFVLVKTQGGKITYSGDKLEVGASALLLSNHQSMSDFYMVGALAVHLGMEPYNRYFIKDSAKYMPFFGWGLYFTGQLFMKRNWEYDRTLIDKVFGHILNSRLPVWIISYPEGTRFSEKKHTEALQFAKYRNLPKFENVLVPRVKGPIAAINKLRHSHIKYVYDVTMAYRHVDGGEAGFRLSPNPLKIHYSRWISPPYQFHIHVEKFILDDLPSDPQALSAWIMDRFEKKDVILKSLKRKGWTDNLPKYHKVRVSPYFVFV